MENQKDDKHPTPATYCFKIRPFLEMAKIQKIMEAFKRFTVENEDRNCENLKK